MNANELLAYNQGYNAGLKAGIDLNTEPMLRQQQNEIEFLKKEILEKHEDWKHEGQQAANARAEIEALKLHIQGLQASITLGEKYMARKNPVETLENIGAILRKAGEK